MLIGNYKAQTSREDFYFCTEAVSSWSLLLSPIVSFRTRSERARKRRLALPGGRCYKRRYLARLTHTHTHARARTRIHTHTHIHIFSLSLPSSYTCLFVTGKAKREEAEIEDGSDRSGCRSERVERGEGSIISAFEMRTHRCVRYIYTHTEGGKGESEVTTAKTSLFGTRL